MNYKLSRISAQQTHALRRSVLRPGQTLAELDYPGDHAAPTEHWGVFVENMLKGIGSLYHEPREGSSDLGEWRLRGMAIDADVRGQQLGRLLLGQIEMRVRMLGGRLLWCNARVSALGFYEKQGFASEGPAFEVAGIGPHFLMTKPLLES